MEWDIIDIIVEITIPFVDVYFRGVPIFDILIYAYIVLRFGCLSNFYYNGIILDITNDLLFDNAIVFFQ